MRYQFKLPPYPHQVVEFNHHLRHFSSATFSETGAGKTLPMLASTEARIRWGLAKKALYVAPNYLLSNIAQKVELCTDLSYTILHHGNRQKRIGLIDSPTELHLINIEALHLYEEYLRETLKRGKYDIMLMDEAHYIKSWRKTRAQAAIRLANLAKFRIAATGTPFTREPEDIYGIMKFVDPNVFKMTIGQFQQRFCNRVTVDIGWSGDSADSRKITRGFKEGVEEEFRSQYKGLVVIHKKEDCLTLPPKVFEVRRVPMAAKIKQPYRKIMRDRAITMPDGMVITMANKGVMANRLAQLCSGFMQYKGDDGKDRLHHFGDSNKIEALRDILVGRRDKKTVVWCKYRESIFRLQRIFKDWMPVIQVGQHKNELSRDRFMNDPDCKLIICQLQINAGYELTESGCNVYYEMPHSYADWKQSQDRTHRPGAEKHRQILYYLLVTQDSIEPSIRVGLKFKEDLSDLVVMRDPDQVFLGQLEDDDDQMPLPMAA